MKKVILVMLIILFSCNKDENIKEHEIYNYTYKPSEIMLLELINVYRAQCSLDTLVSNQHISKLCQDHNIYMIQTHNISHCYFTYRADNIEQTLNASKVGENIAYNYTNPLSILNAWKNSPGHDENLKEDFNTIGVSIEEDSIHHKYVTLILAKI